MDAARDAMGQGWPFAACPWNNDGTKEVWRRSRQTRMPGALSLGLLSLCANKEKVTRREGEKHDCCVIRDYENKFGFSSFDLDAHMVIKSKKPTPARTQQQLKNMKKITLGIENLGPITDASIEIAPLTIVCGSNNSGKTYISYTIYGLFRSWYSNIEFNYFDNNAKELSQTGFCEVDISPIIENQEEILRALLDKYKKFADSLFSAPKGTFPETNIKIKSEIRKPENEELDVEIDFDELGKVKYSEKGNIITFVRLNPEKPLPLERAKSIIDLYAALHVFEDYFPTPFIITAERLGISLFYKELDSNRNALVDTLMKLKDDQDSFNPQKILERAVSRYSLPVKTNIRFARELENLKKEKSFLQNREEKIYTDIEKMLGGEYKVNGENISFKSKSRTNKYHIPSYLGSSAVRSLSDVYFYLKHKAKEGDLLLIDEPESHLTPLNQIQTARIIARLVNAGINVFITTHSDYIIKELNNLIRLNNDFPERSKIIKKYNYKSTDRLDHNNISAYTAKEGHLEKCQVSHTGIEIISFDEAIDQINAASDDLLYYTN